MITASQLYMMLTMRAACIGVSLFCDVLQAMITVSNICESEVYGMCISEVELILLFSKFDYGLVRC